MSQSVDVVVVGLGPGGEDVAGRLAEAGLDVVGVESTLVGGECPYWGCVPSKMMIRAAGLLAEARRIPGMAGTVSVAPDYAPVAQRIRQEATDSWDDTVAVDRFVGKGGTFVRGTGRLAGPGRVQVGDQVFTAGRAVVLATGTQAAVPPIDGLTGTPFWTNRQAIEAEQPPRSLIVLGGGAVGLELAQVFARFGADVTVVEAADRLLPSEEPEAGALLADVLTRDGLTVRTGSAAGAVRHDPTGYTVTVGGQELTAERLLVATGRRADLSELGLESVDLDPSARWLDVDEHLRAAPGLWGVGDLTGRGAFTHVAMYQAQIAVRSILGEQGPPASYHALPRVTFTDPEVGAVGLTQAQAQASGLRVRVGTSQVPSSARGWIHKAGNDGLIKLVEDADRGVLVGATTAGPNGGEVRRARGRRPRRRTHPHAAADDLRLPHLPPRHRGRPARLELIPAANATSYTTVGPAAITAIRPRGCSVRGVADVTAFVSLAPAGRRAAARELYTCKRDTVPAPCVSNAW